MIEERQLGFDARESWADPGELWDRARREAFLLRLDAPRPLSTDTLVWPSVFDTGQGIGLPAAERQRLYLAGMPTPGWIGPNAGLWDNLDTMRQYLAERWAEPRPHAVVAVSWVSDVGFEQIGDVGPYPLPVTPPTRDATWELLGFDVADGSLVSGLSNCGYTPPEAQRLRRQWRRHLNASHLFSRAEHALRFREVANTRTPEHAPFFVYGLYLVQETS